MDSTFTHLVVIAGIRVDNPGSQFVTGGHVMPESLDFLGIARCSRSRKSAYSSHLCALTLVGDATLRLTRDFGGGLANYRIEGRAE